MDLSKNNAVFKELAAHCKEKRKWALAAFDKGWKSASAKASSFPAPVEQVAISVPVEHMVVRPEEGVVNPPCCI